jgi:hypothetical protein
VIRHIRKFTGIFWRSTLLTITFNQALFFGGNFSKKKITKNNVSVRPRPGQPRVTTDQQDRHIRVQHLRNRFKTAAQVDRVLSKSGFKKFISPVHDLHVQEILFLKFNRYLFQVIRHIRKFTGIFLRRTLFDHP